MTRREQREHYKTYIDGGFSARDIPRQLALIHSEVSEALECARKCEMYTCIREDGKPEGLGSELADIVIRTAILAESLDIDLDQEIHTKGEYNKTRPYKHGGKAF